MGYCRFPLPLVMVSGVGFRSRCFPSPYFFSHSSRESMGGNYTTYLTLISAVTVAALRSGPLTQQNFNRIHL